MQVSVLKPKQSLNKAYLKEKVGRVEIELFKSQLSSLLSKCGDDYSEDTLKDFAGDFLKAVYFRDRYFVSVNKERKDLAIHTGKAIKDPVGIIVEVKRLQSTEMFTPAKPNVKAFHELVLYYLHERVTMGNLEIKHLAATNIFSWYLFDANEFDKKIHGNPAIKKLYEVYVQDKKDNTWFYNELKSLLNATDEVFYCTHADLKSLEKTAANVSRSDDNQLIPVYKLLSPEHLLKKPFANDSNSLDKGFYTELLHLIGLEEVKEGSKKLIRRKSEAGRSEASLLENAMIKLHDREVLRHVSNQRQYGESNEEQLQSIALELCITWINRVLFLKLLEAQVYQYHKKDPSYLFLDTRLVHDFDELNNLFFQVLAEKPESRRAQVKEKFALVPYLNSSLFDRTDLERLTIDISSLDNRLLLPLHKDTVLKDQKGKKLTGSLHLLEYLFRFLDAYDFTSEGKGEIQEENKALINASVLGLIFEKINGYKDGSFFTPGFITMYMCRETLRRAVVQKFREAKDWTIDTYDKLYDAIEDREEANAIINSIRICDPAVGSGHFLVSALNELIAIKADLRILQDRQGRRLKEYSVSVENDELVITDENDDPFDYVPGHPESQRVQEAIFHEKEKLIENCLFGVDINPNSTKICRLRLWIELLKNAYYTKESGFKELETLPNIDINIKEGNSLVSRFGLDTDVSEVLKQSKWTIDSYRLAVQNYKNAETKEEKRELEDLIRSIKNDFRKNISTYDPVRKKLSAKRGEMHKLTQTRELFGPDEKKKKASLKQVEKLSSEIEALEKEITDAENSRIYENAFEWRFEFPEVLDDEGRFVGFDVVIGNPPYLRVRDDINLRDYFERTFTSVENQFDLYQLFIELAHRLIKQMCFVTYIIPNAFLGNESNNRLRSFILKSFKISFVVDIKTTVFEEASVEVAIVQLFKSNSQISSRYYEAKNEQVCFIHEFEQDLFHRTPNNNFTITVSKDSSKIFDKIIQHSIPLETYFDVMSGIKEYQVGKGKPKQTVEIVANRTFNANDKKDNSYMPELRGKNVFKYSISWNGEYISYGQWLAEPRDIFYFRGPRLLMRQIPSQKSLVTAFVAEEFIVDQTAYVIKPKSQNKYSVEVALALLNSKLLFWFFRNINNEFDILFPKIKANEIRKLPIVELKEDKIVYEIKELATNVINMKKGDTRSLTTDIENKIDYLIYELYNLTPEEISIIERS